MTFWWVGCNRFGADVEGDSVGRWATDDSGKNQCGWREVEVRIVAAVASILKQAGTWAALDGGVV